MKVKKKVAKLMLEMENVKENRTELDKTYNLLRNKLLEYFEKHNVKEFTYEDENNNLVATTYSRETISYDIGKLKKKLPKEVFKQIIQSTIIINNNKLQEMFEKKLIKVNQLRGCYEIKTANVVVLDRKPFQKPEVNPD